MQKKIATLIICTLAILASPAVGETVDIPLPQLVGSYPSNPNEVTVTIQHDFGGRAILGAQLHLVGTVTVGEIECTDGTSSNYPMDLGAYLGDTFQSAYRTFGFVGDDPSLDPGDTAEFDELRTLVGGSQAMGWGFLEDGEAPLLFYFAPPPIVGICGVVTYSSGTITEATLVIELEPIIPVSEFNWGVVKARY